MSGNLSARFNSTMASLSSHPIYTRSGIAVTAAVFLGLLTLTGDSAGVGRRMAAGSVVALFILSILEADTTPTQKAAFEYVKFTAAACAFFGALAALWNTHLGDYVTAICIGLGIAAVLGGSLLVHESRRNK
jgi:peptidoglycan/LPS O-acetylase OafA/YrhL